MSFNESFTFPDGQQVGDLKQGAQKYQPVCFIGEIHVLHVDNIKTMPYWTETRETRNSDRVMPFCQIKLCF